MMSMRARIFLLLASGLVGSAVQAQDCETIRAQIESKIRANGVSQFSLQVVEQGATVRGKVVGSCGKGSRKIVYMQLAAGARRAEPLLTECKDGTVSVGGDCPKR
jgi:hypothetical protein